jgi:hypothetical protein
MARENPGENSEVVRTTAPTPDNLCDEVHSLAQNVVKMSSSRLILFQSRFMIASHGAWPRHQPHAFATKAVDDAGSSSPTGVFVKKKDSKSKKGEGGSGLSPKMQRVLDMLMPPSQQLGPGGPPKRSEKDQEKYERRCRDFEEKKALEQESWRVASRERIKLAKAALEALPPDLREKAAIPDLSPFPPNREYLFHTPPTSYGMSYGQEAIKDSKNATKSKQKKNQSDP